MQTHRLFRGVGVSFRFEWPSTLFRVKTHGITCYPLFLAPPFSSWSLERPGDSRSLTQSHREVWPKLASTTSHFQIGRRQGLLGFNHFAVTGVCLSGVGAEFRLAVVSKVTSKGSDPVTSPLGDAKGGRRRRRFPDRPGFLRVDPRSLQPT